jgi:hypothetical protein
MRRMGAEAAKAEGAATNRSGADDEECRGGLLEP